MRNDLTNQRFGRLTVLGDVGKRAKNQKVLWHCLCDCGTITFVRGDHLKSGKVFSCGCLKPTAKSSTGVRGVYYRKNKNNYQVFINVNKKQKYLGSYKSLDEATKVRRQAEEDFWGK